jgi:hypothetical protein
MGRFEPSTVTVLPDTLILLTIMGPLDEGGLLGLEEGGLLGLDEGGGFE